MCLVATVIPVFSVEQSGLSVGQVEPDSRSVCDLFLSLSLGRLMVSLLDCQ